MIHNSYRIQAKNIYSNRIINLVHQINENEGIILAIIELKHVCKQYDKGETIFNDLNLSIQEGDFTVIVGPSGCGKSTLLRIMAGLEQVSGGEIYIADKLENDVPAKKRNIAMVFQNYALYPHMTVAKNIGFGLKMRGAKKAVIKEKVQNAAEMLDLTAYLDKYPADLSGGQMQRVALGRAIVRDSKIYLMDEPLSNLDAKLRATMRVELTKLHRQMQATTVYVTHDQTEAMTMADRIIVLYEGVIQQTGTADEIYTHPANTFVASFIGIPPMNLLQASRQDGEFCLAGQPLNISKVPADQTDLIIGLRPEDISPTFDSPIAMTVDVVENMGADQYVHGTLGAQPIVFRDSSHTHYHQGQSVGLHFNRHISNFYDPQTTQRLEEATWQ